MDPSSFLAVLALGLAIWAFIPRLRRDFILQFFSKYELATGFFMLAYINYLMAFNWLLNNWFPVLGIFTIEKGIPSETYGYLIALFLLFYPVFKVRYRFFSEENLESLIDLYERNIDQDNIELVVDYINKYNKNDIIKVLTLESNLPETDDGGLLFRQRTEGDDKLDKILQNTRYWFAHTVYGRVISSDSFIRKASNRFPELFADIIGGIKNEKTSNEDLVKTYLWEIFQAKNDKLVKELKKAWDSAGDIQSLQSRFHTPILSGLLVNTKAAAANYPWKPIGEVTIRSLKGDTEEQTFLRRKYDGDFEDELWQQHSWLSVVFFDSMVKETIYRDSEWHMWMFYFRNFTEHILELFPLQNDYEPNSEYPSFGHKVLYEMFHSIIGWLDKSIELSNTNQVIDSIKCYGNCFFQICEAPDDIISDKYCFYQINSIINLYLETIDDANAGEEPQKTINEWLLRFFKNPKWVDGMSAKDHTRYIQRLNFAWSEFDKIPFTYHGRGTLIDDFQTKVIDHWKN